MSISSHLLRMLVAQLGTRLTRVQLQAPFTDIGQEFITGLLWACAISSLLPGTPQNVSVYWRTSLWCFCLWGFSAAAALWLACAPAPHFGCQQSSLGGSLCWGAAFDPYTDEPPVRPMVLPEDPPSLTDPVRPDSVVWPKWPNPIINFFFLVQIQFLSKAREGLSKA